MATNKGGPVLTEYNTLYSEWHTLVLCTTDCTVSDTLWWHTHSLRKGISFSYQWQIFELYSVYLKNIKMSFFILLEKKGNFGVFEEFFGDFDDCTHFISRKQRCDKFCVAGVRCQQLWLRTEGEIPAPLCPRRSQHWLPGAGKIDWLPSARKIFAKICSISVGDWGLQIASPQFEWR